jgi:hypothetical protein
VAIDSKLRRRLVYMSSLADFADNFTKLIIALNIERYVENPSCTCLWSSLLLHLCSNFDHQFLAVLWLFTLLRLSAVLRMRLLALRLLVLRLVLLRLLFLQLLLLTRRLLRLRLLLLTR